ncbi:MAG: FAD-dependent monooxygenase [Polaromonas sp.]
MSGQVIVTGGGIGGLAAALALGRAGCEVRLFEQADAFSSEVGAGIQLGPNATRLLHRWGLGSALADVAAFPDKLQVRSATTGHTLGELPLGAAMQKRYGAPYATVHRADLHALLLRAVQQQGNTRLHVRRPLLAFSQTPDAVIVQTPDFPDIEADALIGADGLWSAVRQQLLLDAPPLATGHLAYRALVLQSDLPEALRSQHVTVWLGPRLHIVQYPVRGGEQLNLVAIVHGQLPDGADPWDNSVQAANMAADLGTALAGSCPALMAQMAAVPRWRRWALFERPPMLGAHQHAVGRVALLGDAAHPMRPYLAQGAGMAIEDAAALGDAWRGVTRVADVPTALQQFAHARWQRNARVQAKAKRNGEVFHATGPLRWGRDTAMKLLGRRLLDMPWLYGAR